MITCRRCSLKDEKLWIQLNREFMAYEIEDDELWNGTGSRRKGMRKDTVSVGRDESGCKKVL